ncbi:hypothetical protein OQX61_22210 [Pedobacter sp. PLR]|uniref:hypothetical protein n=1 Tax=Pedobacter sp. PLR TaxID=2994465 RepID=UPI0022458977|nr:hypothetical protein [Pedobacter sp. PLR]MCX2453999.1 hypothetical protein [Pedobacter sp. PLR]
MEFKYLAIGLCVALGVFLLISETRRKRKAHLAWRLAASTVGILCFYLLLYPPVYTTSKAGRVQEINLLSAGARDGSDKGLGLFSADINTLKGSSYVLDYQLFMVHKKTGVRYISDLEYFLKSNPDLQVVHIYGHGLNANQLQLLKGKQLSFHPGPVQDGLTALNWNGQLKATAELVLQGTYQHTGSEPVTLLLEGLGTKMDSVTIAKKGLQSFSLKANPQQAGKAVFRLTGIKGADDILFTAPVPIEIKPSDPVKILMLASNPDFEYKFLKNWFFEKKYPLVFRTRISKDKYSKDFLNTDIRDVNTITAALLKKMDLVILDEAELAQLSGAELSNIKHAVEEGLGLFISVNSPKPAFGNGTGTAFGIGTGRYESQALKNKPLKAGFANHGAMLSALPVEQTLFLKSNNNDQPVIQESGGKILVSTSIYGMGRQTLSVLPATYQWLLNGSSADYARFWAEMLDKTARAAEVQQSWSVSPALPKTGERLNISISLSQGGVLPRFKLANELISPLQNRELPTQWQLNTWATQPGWNTLSFGDTNDSFYVYEASDWQQLRNAQNRLATAQFVNEHPIQTKVLETSVLLEKKFSLWWFFIPLLLSVSFLWYETKML